MKKCLDLDGAIIKVAELVSLITTIYVSRMFTDIFLGNAI